MGKAGESLPPPPFSGRGTNGLFMRTNFVQFFAERFEFINGLDNNPLCTFRDPFFIRKESHMHRLKPLKNCSFSEFGNDQRWSLKSYEFFEILW